MKKILPFAACVLNILTWERQTQQCDYKKFICITAAWKDSEASPSLSLKKPSLKRLSPQFLEINFLNQQIERETIVCLMPTRLKIVKSILQGTDQIQKWRKEPHVKRAIK